MKPTKTKILILLFIISTELLCSCLAQTTIRPLFPCTEKLDDPYGIHTHLTRSGERNDFETHKKAINRIKELGINMVRIEMDCPYIAPIGEPFTPARFDKILSTLNTNEIDIHGLLSQLKWNIFSWEDTFSHYRYVDYTVQRYKDLVHSWEVLNEVDRYPENIKKSELYTQILKGTYNHIKAIDSTALVVYNGLSWGKASLLSETIKLGASDYFDIMNFHFYDIPERLPEMLHVIRRNMDTYKWEKPVWITEIGSSTTISNPQNINIIVDETEQAVRIPQTYILAFSYGVDKVFYYDLRSPEIDVNNKEDYFGIVHKNYTLKPAFNAFKTLIKMCPNGSSRPTVDVRNGIYETQWIRPDGKKILALWTLDGNVPYKIQNYNKSRIYDIYGKRIRNQSNIVIVSESIIYIMN